VFVHLGFFDEALEHADLALKLNPSNWQALNSRAQAFLWMGKNEEALPILVSIPGSVLAELVDANTAFALLRLGRTEEARAHLQHAAGKYPNGDPSGNLQGVQAMLVAGSDADRAQDLIQVAGCALARMRRAREAVQWLREAAATGFPCYALFARDPDLDPIRSDPVFQAFLAELQKSSTVLRKTLFPDRP
jgi:tetratricopeptide (TPR) repeat protein